MNFRFFTLALFLFLACFAGCYSLPKQRGTWEGERVLITLYDAKGREYTCLGLQITSGPALKKFAPQKVVLADPDLRVFSSNDYGGKRLRVTGQVLSDYPRSPVNRELLIGYRPDPQGDMPGIYVLKVSKVESF